ncbi:MAG: hypothetical protein ACKN85_00955 [Pirellula sp.]
MRPRVLAYRPRKLGAWHLGEEQAKASVPAAGRERKLGAWHLCEEQAKASIPTTGLDRKLGARHLNARTGNARECSGTVPEKIA